MSLIAYSVIIGWLLLIINRTNGTCPYTNSDYPGSDINPRQWAADWQGCAYQCEQSSCVGWVFDSVTNYCYRKNGWSASGIKSKTGVYTGPKSCNSGCNYKFLDTAWTTSSNPTCPAGDTPGPIETRVVNGQTQYRRTCRKAVIYTWTSWKTGSKPSCPSGWTSQSTQRRWKTWAFDYEYRRYCWKQVTCSNANFFDFNNYDDYDVDKYNWNLWDIVIVSIVTASMVICLYHLMCKLYKIYCHRAKNGGYKHVKTIYDTDTDIEMVENKPINE